MQQKADDDVFIKRPHPNPAQKHPKEHQYSKHMFDLLIEWVDDLANHAIRMRDIITREALQKEVKTCAIEMMHNFIRTRHNWVNTDELQCLMSACFILSLKVMSSHDYDIAEQFTSVRGISRITADACSPEVINKYIRQITTETDWRLCYNTLRQQIDMGTETELEKLLRKCANHPDKSRFGSVDDVVIKRIESEYGEYYMCYTKEELGL
jgi:hypothetical protein